MCRGIEKKKFESFFVSWSVSEKFENWSFIFFGLLAHLSKKNGGGCLTVVGSIFNFC